jgi:hypothetical protein
MKSYRGEINKKMLSKSVIIVFGSNTQGRHGKGMAQFCLENCGAQYGNPRGRQGNSYAIITKDLTKSFHPSIQRYVIEMQIDEMYEYARSLPEFDFLVPYRAKAKYLNGYDAIDMAMMFNRGNIPPNIVFEDQFLNLMLDPSVKEAYESRRSLSQFTPRNTGHRRY